MEGPYSARFYWILAGGLTVDQISDAAYQHEPVLIDEILKMFDHLNSDHHRAGVIVDATLGGAGHAEALLDSLPANVGLIGVDQDPIALEAAAKRLEPFGTRVSLVRGNFENLADLIAKVRSTTGFSTWAASQGRAQSSEANRLLDSSVEMAGDEQDLTEGGDVAVYGILMDLGVSSPQLDVAARGFSYMKDAPLDMRMDPSRSLTAAEVVNSYSEEQLRTILFKFGEERFARRIAAAIVARREETPFETTTDLAQVVRYAIPAAARRSGPHPARRTFQALRIEVNSELQVLEDGLRSGASVLSTGGRMVVISYHSLEDRIVKQYFRSLSSPPSMPRGLPVTTIPEPPFKLVTPKPVRPGQQEIERNPRSDSAKLRVLERVSSDGSSVGDSDAAMRHGDAGGPT